MGYGSEGADMGVLDACQRASERLIGGDPCYRQY